MAMRARVQPLPQVAAIYVRVSSKEQAENGKTSPQTQEDGCRAWATTNGFPTSPDLVFFDKHSGEELWERPALTRLREAAKRREFAVVVCHSTERLSRDAVHLGIVVQELDRQGIKVEFVTETLDDSPDAALIRMVRAYAGKIENERRKERTMRAVRARAVAGKLIPSNRPPFGYRWGPEVDANGKLTKVRLVVDPVTAPIVVRIYEDIAAGKSLRAVAGALTREGVPTPTRRSTHWHPTTVRDIVKLSTYWGRPMALRSQSVPLEPGLRPYYAHAIRRVDRAEGEVIALPDGVAPALVSRELAEAALARLQANREFAARNNSTNPHTALLRGGIGRCGYCDGALYVNHIHARPQTNSRGIHGEYWVYRCRLATHTRGRCSVHAITTPRLDDAVWQAVCHLLRNPHLIERELAAMQATEAPGSDTLATIDARIADVARRLAKVRRLA
jgi:site-specific DNA recombinase